MPFPFIPLSFERLEEQSHTPSPMRFLSEVLGRPQHERPYLLIPVGYPAPHARVPQITRKSLDEVREIV